MGYIIFKCLCQLLGKMTIYCWNSLINVQLCFIIPDIALTFQVTHIGSNYFYDKWTTR